MVAFGYVTHYVPALGDRQLHHPASPSSTSTASNAPSATTKLQLIQISCYSLMDPPSVQIAVTIATFANNPFLTKRS